ncbi:hypothetical protein C6P96_19040 [Burkholderia multivorans]|nr:hypothetical protein C6P95_19065 [Burkholderia multivorans]PRF09845.1 hypothetical protein C6P96_19040 [Burkholderia multivorans]
MQKLRSLTISLIFLKEECQIVNILDIIDINISSKFGNLKIRNLRDIFLQRHRRLSRLFKPIQLTTNFVLNLFF